jgi:hypothetical protein
MKLCYECKKTETPHNILKTFVDGKFLYARLLGKNEKIILNENYELVVYVTIFGEEKRMLLKIK